jgi:uncharacterized membrane protein
MHRAAAMAAALVPTLAAAQPAPQLATLHGTLSLEGKQVALPEGEWLRAAAAEAEGGVVSVALLQLRDGQVAGGVLMQANKAGAPGSWGSAPACTRGDLPLARVRYASDHDGSCAYIAVAESAPGGGAVDPAWAEAGRVAAADGWPMPSRWAVAAIRVSDPLAAVQVRYAFPLPQGETLPPGLSAWTETAWDGVERGLLNLPDPARPLPPVGPTEPPPAEGKGGGLPRAVWKTLTFRAIATTIDFSTNVIAIGNLTTAALLSAWNTVTGPWIYLGHELAWDYFGAPSVRQRDLPGLGPEAGASPHNRDGSSG